MSDNKEDMPNTGLATPYGPHVRIRCTSGKPPSCDLVVEKRADNAWVEVGRFNDMSDDYAHTNADALARATRAKILEGEHG